MIARGLFLTNQSASFCSLDQRHHCIVAFLEKLGQLGDSSPSLASKPGDTKQQLMLLRSEAI
jgi:hypothetical protein